MYRRSNLYDNSLYWTAYCRNTLDSCYVNALSWRRRRTPRRSTVHCVCDGFKRVAGCPFTFRILKPDANPGGPCFNFVFISEILMIFSRLSSSTAGGGSVTIRENERRRGWCRAETLQQSGKRHERASLLPRNCSK